MKIQPLLGLLLTVAAVPAVAQTSDQTTGRTPQEEYQRGYAATPMPNQANINAGGAAGTAGLNDQVLQAQGAQSAARGADQAQYDADRVAYMDALIQHDHAVRRTDARYARQQNAYADAMAVWRAQVAACKRGSSRACNTPAPNPADFY